jgi:deazaflavin-dependent oxidoreductase (nitroreductase family)
MPREYRLTLPRRVANRLIKPLVKLGIVPSRTHLLTVRGRKSGRPYTTPVNLVERDGGRYLVAPYGEVSWVRNARAAGRVSLRRGRQEETRRIAEVPAAESLPVLEAYWRANPITRPFFAASPEDGAAFSADGQRHPVFRLL